MVDGKIQKEQHDWGRFYRMLVWEREDPHMSGRFYITVVKSILIFGLETWVVMPHIRRSMWSIHNKVACQISGIISQQLQNRGYY